MYIETKEIIGKGSYSVVRKGIYNNTDICIKHSSQNISKEYDVLKSLNHKNIISPIQIIDQNTLMFPLYDGTLLSLLENNLMNDTLLEDVVRQIIPTFVYIKHLNLYHNDPFLDNILYRIIDGKYHFVISDFEGASYYKPILSSEDIWSMYQDPVLFDDMKSRILEYQFRQDNYTNESIAFQTTINNVVNKIQNPIFKDLISNVLTLDFSNRLSTKNILLHPFFV